MNGRTPVYLCLAALSLLAVAMLVFQPYSADWPGTGYAQPARRFIRAALRDDSVGLARLSASPAPVAWALDAARAHRHSLELWARHPQAFVGTRQGDTTEVFVYPGGEVCGEDPLVLRFVGSGGDLRVAAASSSCIDR